MQYHTTHQAVVTFGMSPLNDSHTKFEVVAIVVPRITCDLPFAPVLLKEEWNYLDDLELADPGFGCPGRVDILLGIDVFVRAVLQGRRSGPPDSPIAFETHFGWALAGSVESSTPTPQEVTCHAT